MLPGHQNLATALKAPGISRRQFLEFCSATSPPWHCHSDMWLRLRRLYRRRKTPSWSGCNFRTVQGIPNPSCAQAGPLSWRWFSICSRGKITS